MRMGMVLEKIAWWEGGKEICEEPWQDWLSMHNKVAERGIGYQKARKKKERKTKMSKEIVELVKQKNQVRKKRREEEAMEGA